MSGTSEKVEVPAFCHALPTEESIGYQMRRIVTLLGGEIERQMVPLGLTDAQWKPLLRMYLNQDCTVAALARGCHLDAGAMTRLLDRLEAKGLCRRCRSVEDRRVVNLELTAEGLAAAAQIPAILDRIQGVAAQGFSAEEYRQLKDFLARILINIVPLASNASTDSEGGSTT
ncbi:MarR family winged helix-turn-helix transcriptional regulator [Xylophilus sp. ASV27]|uniref:MarR family winged helix-turn-helix transcriptional regulator n=1 Tax=Xylophilus sp. ASV27 TaxID=2795129 RepID=UPI001E4A8EAC|nr:MarR family transcriptional regulator [Xylophilus sp. ASV27]